MKIPWFYYLAALFLPFFSSAQPYNNLTLSTATPEVGKPIHFTYTGDFSTKMSPHLTLYYHWDRGMRWQTLKVKHTDKGVEGTFILPDSTLSFCIKPRNNPRKSEEYFTFNVYKNKVLVKGSLASSADFYSNSSYSEGGERYEKAMDLLQQEFDLNPDLKSMYLYDYYQSAWRTKSPGVFAQILKTWQDSLRTGSDEVFMNNLYGLISSEFSAKEKSQTYLNELLQKFPQGVKAMDKVVQEVMELKGGNLGESDIDQLVRRFNDSRYLPRIDGLYANLIQKSISEGRYADFERLMGKLKSVRQRSHFYLEAAKKQFNQSNNLVESERYLRKAKESITAMREGAMPYYVFDRRNWNSMVSVIEGDCLSLSAELEYKKNNKSAAIDTLKKALVLGSWNMTHKEQYLQWLLESDRKKEALDSASSYVCKLQVNAQILDLLKKAYVKTTGSEKDYASYLQSLYLLGQKTFLAKREDYLINEKYIDFSLKDLAGHEVKLSSFKGKIVLLYFFDANKSRYKDGFNEHLAMFSKKLETYKDQKNLVCLFIDRTSVFNNDAEERKRKRMDLIRGYMNEYNYQFQVFIDPEHYDLENPLNSYFEISDIYSSDRLDQFYLIDEKGMVRYKSFPVNDENMVQYEREVTNVIELHLKEMQFKNKVILPLNSIKRQILE